jgi:hypothetical protein
MSAFTDAYNAIPFYGQRGNLQPSAESPTDFGGLLFGGMDSGLSEYLTEDQRRAMQRQALLQSAATLLQASGPSTTRTNIGQVLGQSLAAGAAGYQQAQQGAMAQLLTKQKLDEARRAQKAQEDYQRMIYGQPTEGQAITPDQAISMQGMPLGPTVQRANMIGQAAPSVMPTGGAALTPQMRALLSSLPAEKGIPEMIKMMQPAKTTGQAFKGADGRYYIQTETGGVIPAPVAPADLGAEKFGTPVPMLMNGKTVMVQFNDKGESRIAPNAMPYEPQSQDIRAVEYLLGKNLGGTGQEGIGAVGGYRQQIAPKVETKVTVPVNMTEGQKGFENEMKLAGSFKNEGIYKDFNDMKAAYGQVNTALSQGTPIGDVAGATKMMKLLDPGSVVRETELGIAMAASGRMDRLQNYFNNWASGQKLTPTQRDEFKQLSAELYAAAGQAYNQKRGEYKNFGNAYGFKNLDTALGEEATIPSIVSRQPGGAGKRMPFTDIFKRPK